MAIKGTNLVNDWDCSDELVRRERAWTSELQRLLTLISRLPRNRPYRTAITLLLWGDASKDINDQRADAVSRAVPYFILIY